MSKTTTLAEGQLTNADALSVELHQPTGLPPVVIINWPTAATVASPDQFSDVVAAAFRILGDARTTLSRLRGDRRTR